MDIKKEKILLYEINSIKNLNNIIAELNNSFNVKKNSAENTLFYILDTFDIRFINNRMLLKYSNNKLIFQKFKICIPGN